MSTVTATGTAKVYPDKSLSATAMAYLRGGLDGFTSILKAADIRDKALKCIAAWCKLFEQNLASAFFSDGRSAMAALSVPSFLKNFIGASGRTGILLTALWDGTTARVFQEKDPNTQVAVFYYTTTAKVVALVMELINMLRWAAFTAAMGVCTPATIASKYFYQGTNGTARDMGSLFPFFNIAKDICSVLYSLAETVLRGVEWSQADDAEVPQEEDLPELIYVKDGWEFSKGKRAGRGLRDSKTTVDRSAGALEGKFKAKLKQFGLELLEKGGDIFCAATRLANWKAIPPLALAIIGVFTSTLGMIRVFSNENWRKAHALYLADS